MGKKNNILYIDCFSGISGDMFVGAALDLKTKELDTGILLRELEKLDIKGYRVEATKKKRGAFYGTCFDVRITGEQPTRNFKDIKKIIISSKLKEDVKELSLKIFNEIALAESVVHSIPKEDVHFHEVGAIDSIIDIVCSSLVMKLLNIGKVYGSRVPLGSGRIETMHGIIPIPAPATLEILKNIPTYGGGFDFEVTTPTGAAIMKVLVEDYGDMPDILIDKIGIGVGGKNHNSKILPPNILRLVRGAPPPSLMDVKPGHIKNYKDFTYNELMISTNIDDTTPEVAGYIIERLLQLGVNDAWLEPIYMKKNRPAFKVCVLCSEQKLKEVLKLIFTESSTLGVRMQNTTRFCLQRKIKKLKLSYGEVSVKIGILDGQEITFSPEYNSCKKLAKKVKKPLNEVYRDAIFLLSRK